MKIAIVVDASASILDVPRVFSSGVDTVEVKIPKEKRGTYAKPVNKLAERFDKVFFFTDGEFFDNNISLEQNIEVVLIR